MNNIKILVVEANKKPYQRITKNTESDIYGIVYFPYTEVKLWENVYLIYSKEATENKEKMFKRNISVNGIDIYGTFVIVAKKNNEFISLTDEQIEKLETIL